MARSHCRALVREIDDVIGQDSQFYDLWLFRGTLKYLNGTYDLSTAQKQAAYVNEDENIDMLDVIAVLNMAS